MANRNQIGGRLGILVSKKELAIKTLLTAAFPDYKGRTIHVVLGDQLPVACNVNSWDEGSGRSCTRSFTYNLTHGGCFDAFDGRPGVQMVADASWVVVDHSIVRGKDVGVTIRAKSPLTADEFSVLVDAMLSDPLENGTPRRCGAWWRTLEEMTPDDSWGGPVFHNVYVHTRVTLRDILRACVEGRVAELKHQAELLERQEIEASS